MLGVSVECGIGYPDCLRVFFTSLQFFSSFSCRYFLLFSVFLSQASYLSHNRLFLDFFYFSSSALFKTCLVFSLCVRLNWGGSRGCPGCPDTRPFDQGAHFEKNSVNKYHRECIKTRHFDIRNTKIFSGGAGRGHSFGARPPVPLSDGLHTRPCKILDPPLQLGCQFSSANRLSHRVVSYRVCSG